MPVRNTIFCAEEARAAADPLIGTATEASVWFLVEVRTAWHSDIEVENDLPSAVQDHLQTALTAIPDARMLFIKQSHPADETLRFFIATSTAQPPRLLEIPFQAYEDLLDLDLVALADGRGPGAEKYRRAAPMFLICTNTKRDKCCAKFGVAAFQALQAEFGDDVWQSSHIGGHRYAPNLLLLPHAFQFGAQSPDSLIATVAAYQAGQLAELDHFRGRTSYVPAAQAAETMLRHEQGLTAVDDLWLETAAALPDGRWQLVFATPGGALHEITVLQSATEPRLTSCSPEEYLPLPLFERLA